MAEITKTLKQSGGDYSSMSAWNSAELTDLVTAQDNHTLSIEGTWSVDDTVALNISAWTTDATYGITITTDEDSRAKMPVDSNSYHRAVTTTGLRINIKNVKVRGIYSTITTSASSTAPFYMGTSDSTGSYFLDCHAKVSTTAAAVYGFLIFEDANLINCYAEGLGSSTQNARGFGWVGAGVLENHAFHCMAKGFNVVGPSGQDGFYTHNADPGDKADARGCIAFDNFSADYATLTALGYSANAVNNVSSDATAPGSDAVTSFTPTLVDEAGGDYTLTLEDAEAMPGADWSADNALVLFDFNRVARTRFNAGPLDYRPLDLSSGLDRFIRSPIEDVVRSPIMDPDLYHVN